MSQRLLAIGATVFALGVTLVIAFDSWWSLTVQIVGGAIAILGAWWLEQE